MKRLIGIVVAVVATAGLVAGFGVAGAQPDSTSIDDGPTELVSVEPCRVFDSRLTDAGGWSHLEERKLSVTNPVQIEAQGGNAEGCGVPSGASAVMLNFHALPQATGHIAAWPFDHPFSNATVMTIQRGVRTSNATSLPLCVGEGCTHDLTARVTFRNPADTDKTVTLVGDVVGYFVPAGEGGEGPQGPQGDPGPQGPAGPMLNTLSHLLYVEDGTQDIAHVSYTLAAPVALGDITELTFFQELGDGSGDFGASVILGVDADGDGTYEANDLAWHLGETQHVPATLGDDAFVEMDGISPGTVKVDAPAVAQWWTHNQAGDGFASFADADCYSILQTVVNECGGTRITADSEVHVVRLLLGGSSSWNDVAMRATSLAALLEGATVAVG